MCNNGKQGILIIFFIKSASVPSRPKNIDRDGRKVEFRILSFPLNFISLKMYVSR